MVQNVESAQGEGGEGGHTLKKKREEKRSPQKFIVDGGTSVGPKNLIKNSPFTVSTYSIDKRSHNHACIKEKTIAKKEYQE